MMADDDYPIGQPTVKRCGCYGNCTCERDRRESLRARVLKLIQASPEPLSVPQIELGLQNQGIQDANTFDVRDAVAELIEKHKAEFVPGRLVKPSGE